MNICRLMFSGDICIVYYSRSRSDLLQFLTLQNLLVFPVNFVHSPRILQDLSVFVSLYISLSSSNSTGATKKLFPLQKDADALFPMWSNGLLCSITWRNVTITEQRLDPGPELVLSLNPFVSTHCYVLVLPLAMKQVTTKGLFKQGRELSQRS